MTFAPCAHCDDADDADAARRIIRHAARLEGHLEGLLRDVGGLLETLPAEAVARLTPAQRTALAARRTRTRTSAYILLQLLRDGRAEGLSATAALGLAPAPLAVSVRRRADDTRAYRVDGPICAELAGMDRRVVCRLYDGDGTEEDVQAAAAVLLAAGATTEAEALMAVLPPKEEVRDVG